ncbi:MAG: hypothetical protein M5U34_27145 [Chloroflexi bacterium]|nr:hypothetical protein [Chloroflexota bacterium]
MVGATRQPHGRYADRLCLVCGTLFQPIRELAQRYNVFQATMAASERIFGLLDTTPEIQDAPGAIPLPPIVGRVAFNHVNFGYTPQQLILKDVTLRRTG